MRKHAKRLQFSMSLPGFPGEGETSRSVLSGNAAHPSCDPGSLTGGFRVWNPGLRVEG